MTRIVDPACSVCGHPKDKIIVPHATKHAPTFVVFICPTCDCIEAPRPTTP